ncbi:hypothetical protein [Actinomadura monticuli]|uniref:Uncharacterized protein n=1 Tax=Actinomadura monticuli TaxID=3097367 RepID=A0ABV4Q3Y7_9ACTN
MFERRRADGYIWPANHDLCRVPIANPTLAYPLSLILPMTVEFVRWRAAG